MDGICAIYNEQLQNKRELGKIMYLFCMQSLEIQIIIRQKQVSVRVKSARTKVFLLNHVGRGTAL